MWKLYNSFDSNEIIFFTNVKFKCNKSAIQIDRIFAVIISKQLVLYNDSFRFNFITSNHLNNINPISQI
jgi:hypothetical protein